MMETIVVDSRATHPTIIFAQDTATGATVAVDSKTGEELGAYAHILNKPRGYSKSIMTALLEKARQAVRR